MNSKYKYGDVVVAKVSKVTQKYIIAQTKENQQFTILRNEISDYPNKNIYSLFEVGEMINFIALECKLNKIKQQICYGSFKKNHPNELKSRIYSKLQKTPNGFKNLYNHTQKVFNKLKKPKETKR
ncbi:RNA-binding protein [Mycoplasmopsis bovirhinis]|uniref:RNA-binding protein n=1 Tax=Mycoplasmopsis bovirhinis TaxID=29553 RepID=UPI000BB9E24B|nr:RNA-binding protein [Mycoplasmopsis bovirhinis]ATO30840.1 RNA-binding protein [Mycoplasmopsis bovirhinis]BBA22463.1 S1 RNA-binding domain protein [Mycoplasmopsis bovirhinis]